ncbi:MAG: WYL domain-containing protein [Cetobacterium sp.]
MEKKIRVTLPKRIAEILESDIEEFFIKKNTLLNYLYEEYAKEDYTRLEVEVDKSETSVIQFNLNKKNLRGYYSFLEENKIQNESEFFREILSDYSENCKKKRELFLFKEKVERINDSIAERKLIKVSFRDGKIIEVEPYLIESSKLEVANYLFCYNLKEKLWKNYRIKYIDSVYTKNSNFKIRDIDFIQRMKEDFDPFISFGKKVKIRLTNSGENLFKELQTNRPKVIQKKLNEYILECSEEKAKRYFSFFLDEVEILEPIELRQWFKNKYIKALEQYKK